MFLGSDGGVMKYEILGISILLSRLIAPRSKPISTGAGGGVVDSSDKGAPLSINWYFSSLYSRAEIPYSV